MVKRLNWNPIAFFHSSLLVCMLHALYNEYVLGQIVTEEISMQPFAMFGHFAQFIGLPHNINIVILSFTGTQTLRSLGRGG